MSLTEHAPQLAGHHILTLDIERTPGVAQVPFWGLSDYKYKRIRPDDVLEWPRTICAAWRWYGQKRVQFAAVWEPGGDEAFALATWEAYDKADIVVGHNLQGFDSKHLSGMWQELRMPPPSPYKTVDTLKVARRHFAFESNTLDALCKRLGVQAKSGHYSPTVAQAALAGDVKAQRILASYNKGDIVATEALYDRLRGWMPTHPHVKSGNAFDLPACNQCASQDLERNGIKLAQQITYLLYRCKSCGANVQGTRHSRAAVTRGAS